MQEVHVGFQGGEHVVCDFHPWLPQHLDKGQVGQSQIFIAAAEADLHLLPRGKRTHLGEQAGFANAHFAWHQHNVRASRQRFL
jgi:hypothetical protein